MRPTELQHRHPRDRTPDPLLTKVTFDGRRCSFDSEVPIKQVHKSSSKRFVEYDKLQRRTGFLLGPGAYNPHQSSHSQIKSAAIYKPYHNKEGKKPKYMICGNLLVIDRDGKKQSRPKSALRRTNSRRKMDTVKQAVERLSRTPPPKRPKTPNPDHSENRYAISPTPDKAAPVVVRHKSPLLEANKAHYKRLEMPPHLEHGFEIPSFIKNN